LENGPACCFPPSTTIKSIFHRSNAAKKIRRAIREFHPAFIVNAAAYTAVDKVESEEIVARATNADAPAVMGEEIVAIRVPLGGKAHPRPGLTLNTLIICATAQLTILDLNNVAAMEDREASTTCPQG
jgi:hypothetical protein